MYKMLPEEIVEFLVDDVERKDAEAVDALLVAAAAETEEERMNQCLSLLCMNVRKY